MLSFDNSSGFSELKTCVCRRVWVSGTPAQCCRAPLLSHLATDLRCMGASATSTNTAVVSFTPAAMMTSSPSATVFAAVVTAPITSFPAASSASRRPNLHCRRQQQQNTLACATLKCVLDKMAFDCSESHLDRKSLAFTRKHSRTFYIHHYKKQFNVTQTISVTWGI